MHDDAELQKALRKAARSEDVLLDPRWEAFCAGTLSADERDALLANARAAGLSEEEIAALSPRSDEHDDQLAAEVHKAVTEPAAASAPVVPLPETKAAPVVKLPVASRGGRAWRYYAGAIALAAAAGVALMLRPPSGQEWPAYALEVEGGARDARSDDVPPGTPRFLPDTQITLVARPNAQIGDRPEARAFLATTGAGTPWRVPIEIAEGGAARIRGRAGDLFGKAPAGLLRLCIVVGSSAALSDLTSEPGPLPPNSRYAIACSTVVWQPSGVGP